MISSDRPNGYRSPSSCRGQPWVGGTSSLTCPSRASAVRKLKNSKRDENNMLKFDFKIEWVCDVGTQNDLERIACSIAIEFLRVLTPPGSFATGSSRQQAQGACVGALRDGATESDAGRRLADSRFVSRSLLGSLPALAPVDTSAIIALVPPSPSRKDGRSSRGCNARPC